MKYKLLIIFWILFIFACKNNSPESNIIRLAGTWRLVSRLDKTPDGRIVPEPNLGSDPTAILFYDLYGNMSVQLMKKNRNSLNSNLIPAKESSLTNSSSIAGYDAYFGRYEIDSLNKIITHVIEGALVSSDVGKRLKRNFEFKDDKLFLSLETTNENAGKVTRILIWEKIISN